MNLNITTQEYQLLRAALSQARSAAKQRGDNTTWLSMDLLDDKLANQYFKQLNNQEVKL